MDLIAHLTLLFEHDAWANREVLSNLRAQSTPQPRPLKLIAHVLASQRFWMSRLEPIHPAPSVWPDLTIQECEKQADELQAVWKEYLKNSTEADLAQTIDYINTRGESWSNRKDDILMHLITHSAYHRGQVGRRRPRRRIHPCLYRFHSQHSPGIRKITTMSDSPAVQTRLLHSSFCSSAWC